MTIRDSSRMAYASTAGDRALVRARIVGLLTNHGPMTRRQIADQLDVETSCVAGRVNELIQSGALIEDADLCQCPLSGIRVHWVRAADAREAA